MSLNLPLVTVSFGLQVAVNVCRIIVPLVAAPKLVGLWHQKDKLYVIGRRILDVPPENCAGSIGKRETPAPIHTLVFWGLTASGKQCQ